MVRSLLPWLCLFLSGVVADDTSSAARTERVALVLANATRQLRDASDQLQDIQRRLWGFEWPSNVPDAGALANEAGKVTQNAGNAVGHAAGQAGGAIANTAQSSFHAVQETFNNAKHLVEEGVKVVGNAVGASANFSHQMTSLFREFGPLQPIFAAAHGIIPLLTSNKNMKVLTGFLVELMRRAADLVGIGHAVSAVSHVFNQLFALFNSELEQLNKDGQDSPGRRLFVDYTALLGGLDFTQLKETFDSFERRANGYCEEVQKINSTIYPLLVDLERRQGGRRLSFDQLGADQQKYEGAILSVVPTWREVEHLAIDVCTQTDGAMKQMNSMQCRVHGFANSIRLPGTGEVSDMVTNCDSQADKDVAQKHLEEEHARQCPGVAQSESVRDMLSEQAGVLGWFAVSFEYATKNSTAVAVILGILIFLLGAALAFFGYRYKDCEFWVEGFVAGLVVWSIVTSVIIVYFGVCRSEDYECEPKWLLLIVTILSIGCAFATVKAQGLQLFLAGFDLGAILGGCLFISQFHEQIFNTFVSADSEEAKVIMSWFLASALVTGLILGGLTVYSEKHVIVIATAAIGAFLMVVAFAIWVPHWFDWPDLIGWLLLTGAACAVQYLYTAPQKKDEQNGKDEEMAPLAR